MKMHLMSKKSLLALLLTLASFMAFAQSPGKRIALVVGNGAYTSNYLKNPPNDAADVAAALKDSGFEVNCVIDASLDTFESAVKSFTAALKGAETGLFYYAGHGVTVENSNYLIPVSPRIDDLASVKSRAVAMDLVVAKMEETGVRTILVFLDSCRDNPFPAASRSGTRGLTVVATPVTMNYLIAYATGPGDVAQDGSERNGVFSGAFIRQLKVPGVELSQMMKNVKAEVSATTANKQNPRVDDGMKENFYFVDPELAAARAQGALDRSKSELADLDAQLADLQKKIAASKDAQARQKLQVEQQRQEAIKKAKALESDNLAKEATRQKLAAEAAARLAADRAAAQSASAKAQSELLNLAAARRAELDKLAQDGASENPDVLIETVERLEVVLREVDGQYAAALQRSLDANDSGWKRQLASFPAQQPDITESDAEFALRIATEKSTLQRKHQEELAGIRATAEAKRLSQTSEMRKQFDDTLRTLQSKVWTIAGKGAVLAIGTFDRNAKTWPFTVSSADPMVPMLPVNLVAQLGATSDPKAAILALDAAVKANALSAEFDWGITRDAEKKRYGIDIRAVRVRNLSTNEVVAQIRPNKRTAYFVAGMRTSPIAAWVGVLTVSGDTEDGAAEVFIDGIKGGSLPYTVKMEEKTVTVEVSWGSYKKRFSKTVIVQADTTTAVIASTVALNVGDAGPAGGFIFYDKGKVSDGWRYLEAAPSDQNNHTTGHDAVRLCDDLVLNGFSDWRLPSIDELYLIYNNMYKKGRGSFATTWYWGSVSRGIIFIYNWAMDFSNGSHGKYSGDFYYHARAVRQF